MISLSKSSSADSAIKNTNHTKTVQINNTNKPSCYLVIGGSGFLGSHLVEYFLNNNDNVLIFDCKYPPNDILSRLEILESSNVNHSRFILGDITKYNEIFDACSSTTIDCVFHLAALTDLWRSPLMYQKINVNGTANVIQSCLECNITKLVYTSSSAVVIDGCDIQNGDESLNYSTKHLDAYSYSKQKAEQKILAANNMQCKNKDLHLSTIALRPHNIFGPRDIHFIAQIIDKAKSGKVTHMIGEGHNITDFTFVDNVVHAHILACNKLMINNNANVIPSGHPYFITNCEPTLFWPFINGLLLQLGYPQPKHYIAFNVAYAIGLLLEFIYWLFGWIFGWRPMISRQMVCYMSCHQWFSCSKAQLDLGYQPIVTMDEGIKRTVQWSLQKRGHNYNVVINNNHMNIYQQMQVNDDMKIDHDIE